MDKKIRNLGCRNGGNDAAHRRYSRLIGVTVRSASRGREDNGVSPMFYVLPRLRDHYRDEDRLTENHYRNVFKYHGDKGYSGLNGVVLALMTGWNCKSLIAEVQARITSDKTGLRPDGLVEVLNARNRTSEFEIMYKIVPCLHRSGDIDVAYVTTDLRKELRGSDQNDRSGQDIMFQAFVGHIDGLVAALDTVFNRKGSIGYGRMPREYIIGSKNMAQ
ncbi:MAG: hypothetical protein ABII01_01500 [Candidatus Woesearchaeota archaeon]